MSSATLIPELIPVGLLAAEMKLSNLAMGLRYHLELVEAVDGGLVLVPRGEVEEAVETIQQVARYAGALVAYFAKPEEGPQ
jgi:hypothetical protein